MAKPVNTHQKSRVEYACDLIPKLRQKSQEHKATLQYIVKFEVSLGNLFQKKKEERRGEEKDE